MEKENLQDAKGKSEIPFQKIDAHQHFWRYEPVKDSWITNAMRVIRRDFLPADLRPLLEANGFEGCVAVQASQSESENDFLLSLADEHPFIKGVVGWVDLQSDQLVQRLEYYSGFTKMKGFRHILQGEEKRDLMLAETFKKGIGALNRFGFTYDILIYPDQLRYAQEMTAAFPEQKFVVDHLAKPYIKFKKLKGWKENIQLLAGNGNVHCKLSGFITENDWQDWKADDFTPYFDTVLEAFGADRILFGSDWPVCLLGAPYETVAGLVQDYLSSLTENEQEKIFGRNAAAFYHL